MRKFSIIVSMFLASSAASAFEQRTFMPPNNLHHDQQDADSGITKAQFDAVIGRAKRVYGPIISGMGAKLIIEGNWSDNTVNASADQASPTQWRVNMYGGMARRAEVTEDGFAMVLCHEIGHHLGGYPYVQGWAANEGQSDMHATGACAYKLFAPNELLDDAAAAVLPQNLRAKCDKAHSAEKRGICYRAILAGKSLGDLLGALQNEEVSFDTPDTSTVTRTNHGHPMAQCRLDTYIAGALCGNAKWDYTLIPGKSLAQRNSLEAQAEAFAHSCETGDGARPRCWFAAKDANSPAAECPIADPMLCSLMCQLDPTSPWCE